MALSPAEREQRRRQRMLRKAAEYQIGSYVAKFVAPVFQRMIRAEYGAAEEGFTLAIVNGEIQDVFRRIGQCVCVTCGSVRPWGSDKGMHTGHFLAGRRHSILFEESGVAPQCAGCNQHQGGKPEAFRLWMETVRPWAIPQLEELKLETRTFTREELVDMRIKYQERLKAAERRMDT